MKRFKKIFVGIFGAVCLTCLIFGVIACKFDIGKTDNRDKDIVSVYNVYVAYAQENGTTPLSYEEWLKTIKGEKGDKGDKGEKGEKGDTGDSGLNGKDGKDGTNGQDGIDGKSAYQIWLDNGNTGTQADFLNWLKGKDGTNGADGKDGTNGADGKDGTNGKDGLNGKDGKDGANGKSAYELYKEKYGYSGTEEEWFYDLVNGKLAVKEKHTVTFDSDGGSEVQSQQISDGKKALEPDAPAKTGYTFGGWYVKSSEWKFLAYTVTESVTLKAKWLANEYVIKFNPDGGSDIADVTVRYNEDYVLPTPVRENYVFLGWKEGETAYEQSGNWQKTSGAELTAQWVIAKSTITFEANNGSIVSPMTINYGEDYTLPVITRENFAFVGWFIGEQKFESGTLLTGDITLSAKWKSVTDTFSYTEANGEVTLTEFLGGVTDVVIPAKINGVAVTKLADGIFRNNADITSVTFDGGFENYDAKLFQGCTSLKRLVISGAYDKQLYYLFGDGINDIPESLTEISFAKNSNYVDGTIFKNKVANHTVTYVIPDGTTDILSNQFYWYNYMKAVRIPDSVTSIGSGAFRGCSGLSSATIPDSVTSIGSSAFYGCSGLTSVIIPDSVTSIGYSAFSGCSGLTSVTIPDSVTSIGESAFDDCSGLTSVTIPDSVTSIGSYAFSYCSGLTSVTIGNCVTSIGSAAFSGCSGLTSVTIPDSVTSIGSGAFRGCSGLTSVTIPDSVTSIGRYAFEGCDKLIKTTKGIRYVDTWVIGVINTSLTTAEIKDGTKGIASSAFRGCSGLTSVTIGNSVTSIGSDAFRGCSGLSSVTIGNGVTSIGESAFDDCSGLKTVYYKGTAEQWRNISIGSYNYKLTGAARYYYSESEPSLNAEGTAYDGNYWHYDTDGVTPVIWKKEN